MSAPSVDPVHDGPGQPVRWGWMRPWHPNPLLRRVDRAEAVIRLLLAAAVLLSVPLGCVLGTQVYRVDAERIRVERATRVPVEATIVTEPAETAPYTTQASVRWDRDGIPGTATATVPQLAREGDRITVWLDRRDRPVPPPRSPDAAPIGGIGTAFLVVFAATGLGWTLVRGCVVLLDRRRYAAWDESWRRTADRL